MELTVQDLFGDYRLATAEEILAAAGKPSIISSRRGMTLITGGGAYVYPLNSPCANRKFLQACFLDNRNRVIVYEELFFGTIDSATVHPRVVAQHALKYNAAKLIVAHNHPSGSSAPSRADELITLRLKEALQLVDVRLLDHFDCGRALHLTGGTGGLIILKRQSHPLAQRFLQHTGPSF